MILPSQINTFILILSIGMYGRPPEKNKRSTIGNKTYKTKRMGKSVSRKNTKFPQTRITFSKERFDLLDDNE